jgi:hypothetical protein
LLTLPHGLPPLCDDDNDNEDDNDDDDNNDDDNDDDDNDDVYLEYYSGKGFHINYSYMSYVKHINSSIKAYV